MSAKLKTLANRCKCGVHLTINEHRTVYEPVKEYLAERDYDESDLPESIKAEIIKRDTLVELQFYPRTPINFYRIVHYDIGMAIDEAIAKIDEIDGPANKKSPKYRQKIKERRVLSALLREKSLTYREIGEPFGITSTCVREDIILVWRLARKLNWDICKHKLDEAIPEDRIKMLRLVCEHWRVDFDGAQQLADSRLQY